MSRIGLDLTQARIVRAAVAMLLVAITAGVGLRQQGRRAQEAEVLGVTVTPASTIVHTPPPTWSRAQSIPLEAEAYCQGDCTMKMYYRPAPQTVEWGETFDLAESDEPWTTRSPYSTQILESPLDGPRKLFRFTIPGSAVISRGVDYFLQMTDAPMAEVPWYDKIYWPGGYFVRAAYQHVHVGTGPMLIHIPPANAYANQPLDIEGELVCASGNPCTADLTYRAATGLLVGATWTTIPMSMSEVFPDTNVRFARATIPASAVTAQGVDYYIIGRDSEGEVRWPAGIPYHGYSVGTSEYGVGTTSHRVEPLPPSVLAHAPHHAWTYMQPLPIDFASNCQLATCSATVWYRTSPEPPGDSSIWLDTSQVLLSEPTDWLEAPLTRTLVHETDGQHEYLWRGAIPGQYLDTPGLDYIIRVIDGSERMYWPAKPAEVWTGDQEGAAALITQHVTVVAPPTIAHSPVLAVREGDDLSIEWRYLCVAEDSANCQTALYRREGVLQLDPFTKVDPSSTTCANCSVSVTAEPTPQHYVLTARVVIAAQNIGNSFQQYYLWATDGHTNVYSPGTTYSGAVVAVDGLPAGEYAPYSVVVYEAPSPTSGPLESTVPIPRCVTIGGYPYCEQVGFFFNEGDNEELELYKAQAKAIDFVAGSETVKAQDQVLGVEGTGDMSPADALRRPERDQYWALEQQQARDAVRMQGDVETFKDQLDVLGGIDAIVTNPQRLVSGVEAQFLDGALLWILDLILGPRAPFPTSYRENQQKDYYCGPATMRIAGRIGGNDKSQATWAQHLKTETYKASAIGDLNRLANDMTNLPSRGNYGYSSKYALRVPESAGDLYLFHAFRIGYYNGPVFDHSQLKMAHFRTYKMTRDAGGHLHLGGGYCFSCNANGQWDSENGKARIQMFEVANIPTEDGQGTGRMWWLPVEELWNGNEAYRSSGSGNPGQIAA